MSDRTKRARFVRNARSLALLAVGAAPACSASVYPGNLDVANGDVASDSAAAVDSVVADVATTDTRPVDAGVGCPAQLPLSGQACSGAMTCDYSGGNCVTDRDIFCRCVPDTTGQTRWQCAPNCDVGPLSPPELA